ncbi:hypothetical protein HDV00_004673 [Rhizophlyctis rosea]|nr:hypothetical protein HDV00_004673 [Rhizophlyctis rosea]
MSYRTTVQHLPLEDLVRIAGYVRRFDIYDRHHQRLARVDRGFRTASFLLHPGDTLSEFRTESALLVGLKDPQRIMHLRSLTLMTGPGAPFNRHVLNVINVSALRVLSLDDNGDLLPIIAAGFSQVKKRFQLQTFTLYTAGIADPQLWPDLQHVTDALAGSPLCELVLTSDADVPEVASHCHLNLSDTFHLLESVTLTSQFVFDDLAASAPNLRTLTIDHGKRADTIPYPTDHIAIANLDEFAYVGDGWVEAISNLPSSTRDTLKSLNIRSYQNNLNDNLASLLPHIRHIQNFRICPRSVDVPLYDYNPDGLIEAIKLCASVEGVSLVLAKKSEDYEVARVRRETRTPVGFRGVWDLDREIKADDEDDE